MITLNWYGLFMNLFGTVDGPLGLNIGFWISMAVVTLVVIIENIVFWGMKPTPEAEIIREEERRRAAGLNLEDDDE